MNKPLDTTELAEWLITQYSQYATKSIGNNHYRFYINHYTVGKICVRVNCVGDEEMIYNGTIDHCVRFWNTL